MHDIQEKETAGIRYLERPGEGVPLLLLHGIGSNASSFSDMMKLLPGSLRVIAWHAPGYSTSTPLNVEWPVATDYADVLVSFIDELQLQQINVLGHSLGTLIAAAFATAYPQRVRLLILASCANGYGQRTGAVLGGSLAARITDLNALGAQEFSSRRAPKLVFEPCLNPEVVAKVKNNMSLLNPGGYAQAVRMLASGDLESTMKQCTVPTRFIVATRDQITPEAQTIAAARAWSAANNGEDPVIERIDDAGHAVYLQRPSAFAAVVQKLIGGSERPQASLT